MNNPYADNPFDTIYAAPVAIPGSNNNNAATSKPVSMSPSQQQQQAAVLDDLINPFAVLGMENKSNKSPTGASTSYHQASGAGYTSPYAASSAAALYSPSRGPQQQPQALAAPQVFAPPQFQQQQQQQQQWGSPSAQSAFQPPAPIVTSQQYSPSVSPVFGSSPSSAYGQASPAYGSYSPASPAFNSGLHTGQGSPYAASASPSGSPYGSGSKASVTDADLSLFAGPVVAVKAATPTRAAAAPQQQQQQQVQQVQQQAATSSSPKADDGWDNDDFGISWEAPKKAAAPIPVAAAAPAPREREQQQEEAAAVESPSRSVGSPSAHGKRPNATEAAIAAEHKMEGNVLARISVRTLIVKEWKETFWIINNGKVLLYRSKEDYLYNPVGVMVKKDIPLRDNLRCSEVTCKPYKGYGDLYHFTLEEMLDYGPSLIAKFASTDVKNIRELRAVIIAYIIAERKKRVGGGRRTPVGPQGHSSVYTNEERHQQQPREQRQQEQVSSPAPRQASPGGGRGGGSPKMESGASTSSAASGAGGADKYAKWGQIS